MRHIFETPEILYKYRDWKIDFHKKILTEQEIYFASTEQFNDPFDGGLPYKLNEKDLTPDNIFKKYLEIEKQINPHLSETELHERAYKEQSKEIHLDSEHIRKVSEFQRDKIRKEIGILSLAEEELNFLMWSHYGNSHQGFCIGFDTLKLYESIKATMIKGIEYSDTIPVHNLFQDTLTFISKSIFVKSNYWSYEKEYRLIAEGAKRAMQFSPDCVKEIVFGVNMLHKTKIEILDIVEKKYPDLYVFEIELSTEKFKLIKKQIR